MILVDTSVWISFLKKSDPHIVDIIKIYIKKQEIYTVSAVFGELLQGVKNQRERDIINILWESLPKVDEQYLFIRAGNISNKYKLFAKGVGLIDCYLLAACADNDLALWTLDKKLQKSFDELAL
ncbi:PIN domain-containing protein [Reichenbachiella sp. MALMAid0571]|uniref:PIN domain-containing protein n=1 Tax=Reichenbachiella sp. MALMAid0571 TaxID=3143939 RepID=UPI0032DE451E